MRRMSGLDRMMLHIESEHIPMDLVGIFILDPSTAPGASHSFERVRAELAARLPGVTVFTSRPIAAPLGAGHDQWLDDPNFDIDYHIRHVGVPAPHDRSALSALIPPLFDQPMDRNRPLWQMYYVDGFDDGSAALLLRIHHASIDGVGGMDMINQVFDSAPLPAHDAAPPAPVSGDRVPTPPEMLVRSLPDQVIAPLRLVQRAVPVALPLLRRAVGGMVKSATPKANSSPTRTASKPPQIPRTVMNRSTSTGKRAVAMMPVAMSDIRRVKDHFGVTINDVVITITNAAVTDYLRARDELPPEPLRVASPVNVRDESAVAGSGNHFSFMFVGIPTDLTDPVERLLAVAALTRRAVPERTARREGDSSRKATGSTLRGVMGLIDSIPSAAYVAAGGLAGSEMIFALPPIANYVVSNIPGPKDRLYLAGAEITHIFGRTMVGGGIGLFIYCISYGDSLDFGMTALSGLIPDPGRIAEGIERHLGLLVKSIDSHASTGSGTVDHDGRHAVTEPPTE
jgi:diacylglycerol O-acyltransferase / wax synthase